MIMMLLYYAVLVLKLVVVCHANSTNLRGGGSSVETRIIGGNTVDDSNRFPYFTLLKGHVLCGGVLIAPNLVVTAAHCENATTQVMVGAYRFNNGNGDNDDYDSSVEIIEIDQQIRHPYHGNSTTNNNNVRSYDIMIIKLKHKSTKQYARLNVDPSIPEDCGTQLSSIGFGDISTELYGPQFPEYLQETNNLRFMNHDICKTRHTGNTLSDDMLCATGNGNGITNPCNGDSGGPLFVKGNTPEEDVVVGTVSWGRGCANSYHPIVYASMSYLFGWIEETACHIMIQQQQQQQRSSSNSQNNGDDDDGEDGEVEDEEQNDNYNNNNNDNIDDDLPDYFDCSKYVEDATGLTTPLPNLEFVTWTVDPTEPLSNCQGDCDDDIDCEGTMICHKSDELDVPGCSGLNSRRIVDYCIQPPSDRR